MYGYCCIFQSAESIQCTTICSISTYCKKHREWTEWAIDAISEFPDDGAWNGFTWNLPTKEMKKIWEAKKQRIADFHRRGDNIGGQRVALGTNYPNQEGGSNYPNQGGAAT